MDAVVEFLLIALTSMRVFREAPPDRHSMSSIVHCNVSVGEHIGLCFRSTPREDSNIRIVNWLLVAVHHRSLRRPPSRL